MKEKTQHDLLNKECTIDYLNYKLDKIEDIEENKQSRAQLKVKIDALQQECESLRDFLEFTKQTK